MRRPGFMVGGTTVQSAGRGVGFDGGSLGIHFGCVSTNVQLILIANSTVLSRRTFENNGNCFVFYVFLQAIVPPSRVAVMDRFIVIQ